MDPSPQLAPDEQLSPELVLVLPPELRAEVIASLRLPVRLAPRPRAPEAPPALAPRPDPVLASLPGPVLAAPPAADESFARQLGALIGARFAQLGLIFAIVTIVTLALSLVAHAVR